MFNAFKLSFDVDILVFFGHFLQRLGSFIQFSVHTVSDLSKEFWFWMIRDEIKQNDYQNVLLLKE